MESKAWQLMQHGKDSVPDPLPALRKHCSCKLLKTGPDQQGSWGGGAVPSLRHTVNVAAPLRAREGGSRCVALPLPSMCSSSGGGEGLCVVQSLLHS
jgi:hypothetical protein